MTIVRGTNGTLTIGDAAYPIDAGWQAETSISCSTAGIWHPISSFRIRLHVHQTRRQRIQTCRFFGLPTSLHRRERRRARKRRGKR
jgi:hypothetical protein